MMEIFNKLFLGRRKGQQFNGFKGFCLAFTILITTAACSTSVVAVPPQPTLTSVATETLTVLPEGTAGFITVTGGRPQPGIPVTVTSSSIPTILPASSAAGAAPGAVEPASETKPVESAKPPFDRFVSAVKNGKKGQVVGVFVENVLALRVVQQPRNNPAYVSTLNGVATQFLMAFQVAGNIGLLAHNFLAGALFFKLRTGDVVQIVYGDGSVEEYEVSSIYRFQALSPKSPTSDFVDLETGDRITANTLFYRMYSGDRHLTLQTCIQEGIEDSWGRLFIVATPL
jgi:hypothetical protein